MIRFQYFHYLITAFAMTCQPLFGDRVQLEILTADYIRPEPPRNFWGEQVESVYLFQETLVNVLRWEKSPDRSVRSYKLFRDDELIAEIGWLKKLRYKDHGRKHHVPNTYTLIAVTGEGNESVPVLVTLP